MLVKDCGVANPNSRAPMDEHGNLKAERKTIRTGGRLNSESEACLQRTHGIVGTYL